MGLCALFSIWRDPQRSQGNSALKNTSTEFQLKSARVQAFALDRHWEGGGDKGRQTEAVGGLNTLWRQKTFFADKFYCCLISRSVLSGLFTHSCAHHQLEDESALTNIKSQRHHTDGHSKVGVDDRLSTGVSSSPAGGVKC